jgi:hypothetical protein
MRGERGANVTFFISSNKNFMKTRITVIFIFFSIVAFGQIDRNGNFSIHRGNFEYIKYEEALGDIPYFIVKKDGKIMSLQNACDEHETLPAPGDMVEIEWKADSVFSYDLNRTKHFDRITNVAVKITKIHDGKLSTFRKTNKKPIDYIFDDVDEMDFPDFTGVLYAREHYIDDIEYFLATTTDKHVLQYLNNQKGTLQIRVYEHWGEQSEHQKGTPNITVKIENHVKNTQTLLILLGIEYYEINNPYYNDEKNPYDYVVNYYRFDEKRGTYIQIK